MTVTTISMRILKAQLASIDKAAKAVGENRSEYMRSAAMERVDAERAARKRRRR